MTEDKILIPEIPNDVLLNKIKIKHFEIEAKVIRKNGKIENYGVIAGFDKNIFKNALLQLKIYLTRLKIKYGISPN